MKKIKFQNKSAKSIYENYISRARRSISVLSEEDKKEILMEINSHIFEALGKKSAESEVDRLISITHGLGDPEEFLKPMVAQKKLGEATRTFNPKHIFQAIILNFRNGILYSLFALLYLCLAGFLFLMVSEILYPNETGLFVHEGKFQALGRLKTTEETTELLGDFFIPTMALSTIVLYLIITLLMRISRKK